MKSAAGIIKDRYDIPLEDIDKSIASNMVWKKYSSNIRYRFKKVFETLEQIASICKVEVVLNSELRNNEEMTKHDLLLGLAVNHGV